MSMLSRRMMGAIASKKARASCPVLAAMASASFDPVSGPVAMIVGCSGSSSMRSRTTFTFGCVSMARVTSAAKASRSTASAEPAGTRCLSRSEEHTSELQSHLNLVCRLLLEKKKKKNENNLYIKKKKQNKQK